MFDVSIIMVSYKMKDDIDKCFNTLFKDFENSGLSVNVVVVDNDSRDGVKDFLKAKYPSVVCEALNNNGGFGRGQNIGIKSVDAKYYFILNPDVIFLQDKNIIKRMYDFMESHPKVGLLGPKILNTDGTLQYSCFRFPIFWQPLFSRTRFGKKGIGKKVCDKFLMKDFDHNGTAPVDWVMGSAMFARKAALDKVGLFDERFWMYAEDSDLCRRMWEAGWPIYYAHDIVIQHGHRRDSAKVPGIFNALIKNKLARVHLISWLKYMWKWRGNLKYYGH
ncbi:MAG: glycosyltransferase family 2 protein [Patescibacteria group bacterium]|nr:glycosyltransferase family 2 protein [Patescibacteria group bacterium]